MTIKVSKVLKKSMKNLFHKLVYTKEQSWLYQCFCFPVGDDSTFTQKTSTTQVEDMGARDIFLKEFLN